MNASTHLVRSSWLLGALVACSSMAFGSADRLRVPLAAGAIACSPEISLLPAQAAAAPESGVHKVWEDRGAPTPTRVFFGPGSSAADPLTRLPAPPYSNFRPDDENKAARNPKAKVTDSRKVKWTVKFGAEMRADTVAPRLAWALGFGAVEGYYVGPGRILGVTRATDRGREKGVVSADGSFAGGRFKRHDPAFDTVKDAGGKDLTWDEARNPGVPAEQLSGLLLFDALVNNWDAQSKNCKVYQRTGPAGAETWFVVSDLGASFADGPWGRYVLAEFRKRSSIVKRVDGGVVEVEFKGQVPAQAALHRRIPLAHARWFARQLDRLTDADLQAAFDAAYATDALSKAYAGGDAAAINAARSRELSAAARTEIAGFVAALRARIDDFKQKVTAG